MDYHSVNGVRRTPARALAVGGIVAPLMWVTAVVYCGAIVPGYSHSEQYISELAAQGSPTQRVMQATGFVLPGVLIAAFGVSIGMRTRARLVGLGAACLVIGAASLLIVSGLANSGDVGTFQRVSLGALNLWMLVLALRQLRRA